MLHQVSIKNIMIKSVTEMFKPKDTWSNDGGNESDDVDILGESPVLIENFENLRHINIGLTKEDDEYNAKEEDYTFWNNLLHKLSQSL